MKLVSMKKTNLRNRKGYNIVKSKDIAFLTKIRMVKAIVFPVVTYVCESWTVKKTESQIIDALELWCWRLLRVPWTARRSNQSILRKSILNVHWKDWCWSWSSNSLAAWCEELTHWKIPWCWERLKAGGEGDDRVLDEWMASLTQWTWVRANSRRQWRTGKPEVLKSMWLQRVKHGWETEQQQEIENVIWAKLRIITQE